MPMQMVLPFHHVKQQQMKSGTAIPIVTLLYGATSNPENLISYVGLFNSRNNPWEINEQ